MDLLPVKVVLIVLYVSVFLTCVVSSLPVQVINTTDTTANVSRGT